MVFQTKYSEKVKNQTAVLLVKTKLIPKCQDLKAPLFHPTMVSLWIKDFFWQESC